MNERSLTGIGAMLLSFDTAPVGTVDFGMSNDDKTFLLAIGRAAALKFLEDRRLDDGPASDVVERARKEAEDLRQLAIEGRRLRRKYRHIRRLTA